MLPPQGQLQLQSALLTLSMLNHLIGRGFGWCYLNKTNIVASEMSLKSFRWDFELKYFQDVCQSNQQDPKNHVL